MIAIVVSRADSASEHIGDHLLDLADWERREDDARPDAEGGGPYYRLDGTSRDASFELREFDALHLEIEETAAAFGEPNAAEATDSGASESAAADSDTPDLLVFVSRHSGDTGPLLTAHFTGNFGPADYGGVEGGLAEACPNAHARLLAAFADHAPDSYEVGMECTHHGPSEVGVPSLFAELGSDEAQWDDPEGARAVAKAVLDLAGVSPHRERQLVGFGGGHYVPRFERIERGTDWTVGHIAADWVLDAMGSPEHNREVVRRAFEESRAERAVIEGDYPDLKRVVADLGYDVVSETWVRETTGVPLELVEALEADLSAISAGLRFGDPAEEFADDTDGLADDRDRTGEMDDAYEVVELPTDLLTEAQSIDDEATREAVIARTLAFETEQSGSRAAGRAAVRDVDDREALVETLADLLHEKYDSVAREDGAVVARQTAFDPEKAQTLGVSEGPAFGKLSAGQSVTVNGREIEPETVQSERVRRFDA
ncbi:D-aminoacyl-tRNA deacylase [Halorussus pelagicus]|uniref:D-aminoacyl-tRNA deacylase n=1 Tax=Halorussus pelagicus TaxID=2505977 RepID=UPI000FFCC1FE|nr:D-aminoacyl-tRNA deacylase [Halorussus pelagicus]